MGYCGEIGSSLEISMETLNLFTRHVELEVRSLLDDLEGGIQGDPRFASIHRRVRGPTWQ